MIKRKLFHYIFTIIIICTIVLINLRCQEGNSGNKEDLNNKKTITEIPIYEGAENVERSYRHDEIVKSISYKIKEKYPAAKLIEFYKSEMKKMGYSSKKYDQSQECSREWSYYIDGTIEGEPKVAHINYCWDKHQKRVLLVLKYYYKNSSFIIFKNNDKLNVEFNIISYGRDNSLN